MTETRFTWRWLLVIAVVGIFMGLAVGLAAGWILFPNVGGSNVAGLSASAQNDYIVLVANTYAYDQDLKHAQERLGQLQDKDIKTRIERLAKSFATRKDPSAANLADLAVALGSDDSSLQVLAEQVTNTSDSPTDNQEPTKIAQVDNSIEPTTTAEEPTVKPTKVKKATPTPKPTEEAAPTDTPKPKAPVAKATAKPTDVPTAAPVAAAVAPQWAPDFPSQWWNGVAFSGAAVAPGQEYWHLKSALYCDVSDQRNNCPNLSGGSSDHTIYVSVVDANGQCADVKINHQINTGEMQDMEKKDVAYPWNPYSCNVDYEWAMYGEGSNIWIDGLPSDKISNLCLCSVINNWSARAHVRYFLVFQKTTR